MTCTQTDIFDAVPQAPESELERVKQLMLDEHWRTPKEICEALYKLYGVEYGSASVTARLRELNYKYGYGKQRRARAANLYEYQITMNKEATA